MASDGIEALRRAILQDAQEMARGEIEQAKQAAAEELDRARREGEAERARILREAEREAEALRRRIESTAELESKRRVLEVRERLIRQVLDRTRAVLREGGRPEARRAGLMRLVAEAAQEAGGGRLVVQTSRADARFLTPEFLAEVQRLLDREGISAELRPAERPAEIAGGAIVSRDEGRLVVDNSLDVRLARLEPLLRADLWRILSGET